MSNRNVPLHLGNERNQHEMILALRLPKGYDSEINVELDDMIYNLYMDDTVYSDIIKLEQLFDKNLMKIN